MTSVLSIPSFIQHPTFHLHLLPYHSRVQVYSLPSKHQGHILQLGKLLLPNKAALNNDNADLQSNSMYSGLATRPEKDGWDITAYDSLQ